MNDTELDRLIAEAASTTNADVRGWDLVVAESDLMEEIMSTEFTSPSDRARADAPAVIDIALGVAAEAVPLTTRRRRHGAAPILAVVAAATAVIAGVAVTKSRDTADVEQRTWDPAAPSTEPSYPAEDIASVEALPHLLIDMPGWSASRARQPMSLESSDPITATGGEVRFEHEDQELAVTWRPAAMQQWVLDQFSGLPPEPVNVAGHEATLFRLAEGETEVIYPEDPDAEWPEYVPAVGEYPDDHAVVWLQGDHVIEVRGTGFGFGLGSTEDFQAVLAGLVETDTEPWMDAVSPVVVWPSARAATVDAMLADVPLPPGLDIAPLRAPTGAIGSRRGVSVEVTRAVLCTWIGSWVDARHTGDEAGVQAAVDALSTARDWDVLVDMADGWSQNAWDYADAVAFGASVPAGSPDVTVEESYQGAIGC